MMNNFTLPRGNRVVQLYFGNYLFDAHSNEISIRFSYLLKVKQISCYEID